MTGKPMASVASLQCYCEEMIPDLLFQSGGAALQIASVGASGQNGYRTMADALQCQILTTRLACSGINLSTRVSAQNKFFREGFITVLSGRTQSDQCTD
jgi:hypothetical protein